MGRYTTYPLTEMEYIPLNEEIHWEKRKRFMVLVGIIGFVIGFVLTLI